MKHIGSKRLNMFALWRRKMTNAEKLKKSMTAQDCVEFYCNNHYCKDCPIAHIKSEKACPELLAE